MHWRIGLDEPCGSATSTQGGRRTARASVYLAPRRPCIDLIAGAPVQREERERSAVPMKKDEIIARLTRERDAARARVAALERMLSVGNDSAIIGYRYGPRPWPARKSQEEETHEDDGV